jgi:hypothetical protein
MGKLGQPNLLRDARVNLSGPMDFVASREAEKRRDRVRSLVQTGNIRRQGVRARG